MRITIIGSGNVATHMAAALKNAHHQIVQVYSRNMVHAALLAYHIRAVAIDDLQNISPDTDLFIIAVNDDSISVIAERLAGFNKLMVHTSGATALQVLISFTNNCGVFYPLQTFSKTREVDFKTVPLCIEGATEEITDLLMQLAQTISSNVQRINSAQRKILHLSAAFACNFTNYLYSVANELLQDNGLDFALLQPLILETAQKIQHHAPITMQTGPAVRKDQSTMNAHLALLNNKPDLQQLYTVLSQFIIKMDNARHGEK